MHCAQLGGGPQATALEALWAALEDFVRRTALAVDVATADAQRFHATASTVRCTD